MPGERRHPGEVPGHIEGLGEGHNGRRGRDPLCHNSVVRAHHNNAPPVQSVFYPAGDSCQLDCRICQLSETPGRRRQRLYVGCRIPHGISVCTPDLLNLFKKLLFRF